MRRGGSRALSGGAAAAAGVEGCPGPGAGVPAALAPARGSGAAEAGRPGTSRQLWRPMTPAGPGVGDRVEGARVRPRTFSRSRRGPFSSLPALVSAVERAGFHLSAPEWAERPWVARGEVARPRPESALLRVRRKDTESFQESRDSLWWLRP